MQPQGSGPPTPAQPHGYVPAPGIQMHPHHSADGSIDSLPSKPSYVAPQFERAVGVPPAPAPPGGYRGPPPPGPPPPPPPPGHQYGPPPPPPGPQHGPPPPGYQYGPPPPGYYQHPPPQQGPVPGSADPMLDVFCIAIACMCFPWTLCCVVPYFMDERRRPQ